VGEVSLGAHLAAMDAQWERFSDDFARQWSPHSNAMQQLC
jgi:hypothetical protein